MIAHLCANMALCVSRRRFLTSALAFAALTMRPLAATASMPARGEEKRLRLFNPKTKEMLETAFCDKGNYVPEALADIDYLMRDLRSGEVKAIDTRLVDLLFDIQSHLQFDEPFHIISGFRSRATNEQLRKQGWAAAKNSYHLHGQAADIRLSETSTAALRRTAFKMNQGGVGYYPRLNFVHLDMGPIRYWRKE